VYWLPVCATHYSGHRGGVASSHCEAMTFASGTPFALPCHKCHNQRIWRCCSLQSHAQERMRNVALTTGRWRWYGYSAMCSTAATVRAYAEQAGLAEDVCAIPHPLRAAHPQTARRPVRRCQTAGRPIVPPSYVRSRVNCGSNSSAMRQASKLYLVLSGDGEIITVAYR
jgi:hypothetical protein